MTSVCILNTLATFGLWRYESEVFMWSNQPDKEITWI
jgi:hypothetical protein